MEFRDWFRKQLKRREWSQAEFSRRSGISDSTVNTWYTGRRVPEPQACEAIAEAFGIDRDVVLDIAGHRPSADPIRPDDPGAEILGMARRIDWTKPSRADTVRVMFQLYLDQDRRQKR